MRKRRMKEVDQEKEEERKDRKDRAEREAGRILPRAASPASPKL